MKISAVEFKPMIPSGPHFTTTTLLATHKHQVLSQTFIATHKLTSKGLLVTQHIPILSSLLKKFKDSSQHHQPLMDMGSGQDQAQSASPTQWDKHGPNSALTTANNNLGDKDRMYNKNCLQFQSLHFVHEIYYF